MANKSKFQAIRGTRDLLPPETALWNRVEQTAHEVFATFGFGEIRPPIFEPTELFARAVGGETDIVSKEMYSFVDYGVARVAALGNAITDWPDPTNDERDFSAYQNTVSAFIDTYHRAVAADELHPSPANKPAIEEVQSRLDALRSCSLQNDKSRELASQIIRAIYLSVRIAELGDYVSLRPEATASVCRAYIEHNMQQLPQPVKLYYMGPMFRRERPQKGRYRQFYQIGAEVLGGPDAPAIDAEVIEMLMTFFDKMRSPGHRRSHQFHRPRRRQLPPRLRREASQPNSKK